jgi:hypothetical protein
VVPVSSDIACAIICHFPCRQEGEYCKTKFYGDAQTGTQSGLFYFFDMQQGLICLVTKLTVNKLPA